MIATGLRNALAVTLGGALGALSRFAVAGWIQRLTGARFPWGTLGVNLIACFALGFLVGRWERSTAPAAWRLLWGVGFMGAFSTYSTFALETGSFLREGWWGGAGTYVGLHLVLGVAAVFAGMAAARLT